MQYRYIKIKQFLRCTCPDRSYSYKFKFCYGIPTKLQCTTSLYGTVFQSFLQILCCIICLLLILPAELKKKLHKHRFVRICCSTRILPSPPTVSIQRQHSSGCALFICCCLHVLLFDLAGMHVNACCSAHAIVIWRVSLHSRQPQHCSTATITVTKVSLHLVYFVLFACFIC